MADFTNTGLPQTIDGTDERDRFEYDFDPDTAGLNLGEDDIDIFRGGDGNDLFVLTPGADRINGQDGLFDRLEVPSFVYVRDGASDTDRLLSVQPFGLFVDLRDNTYGVTWIDDPDDASSLSFISRGGLSNVEIIDGTLGDDILKGSDYVFTFPSGVELGEKFSGGAGVDIIDGRGGPDTLSGGDFLLSDITEPGVIIDVSNGTWIDLAGNIDRFSNIESFEVDGGDDQFYGDDTDNWVRGFNGDNVYDGAGGTDTLDMNYVTVGVSKRIELDLSTGTMINPFGGTDRITDFEIFRGTPLDDLMEGDGLNNTFHGNDGIDNLAGKGGDDTLIGGDGDDTLLGGADNDRLRGDAGADVLNGGVGEDFATYADETGSGGVLFDLTAGTSRDTHGTVDTLVNIEGAIGSQNRDTLLGDDNNNVLRGGDEIDLLEGKGGNDRLYGEDGFDTLKGGGGSDILRGGDGADLLQGGGGRDLLEGGENGDTLEGGKAADELDGGAGTDIHRGGAGNDIFRPNLDADLYDGGAGGRDSIDFAAASGRLIADLQKGTFETADFGTDQVSRIEQVFGTKFNDTIRGDKANNLFLGGLGSDLIEGNGGKDELSGGIGSDFLIGGKGRDILEGGAGSDELSGGGKADILDGGNGNDALKGGGGADRFVFTRGRDVVTDFDTSKDILDMSGDRDGSLALAGFDELKFLASGNANRTVIDLGNNKLILLGVDFGILDTLNVDFA